MRRLYWTYIQHTNLRSNKESALSSHTCAYSGLCYMYSTCYRLASTQAWESPHIIRIQPRYSNYPAIHKHSLMLWKRHTSQFHACIPMPVTECSQGCHAVFISAEASSELCMVPVTISSPQCQWNLPRKKKNIIKSSSRELSAGKISRGFTFVRQWSSWNSYSTQFE